MKFLKIGRFYEVRISIPARMVRQCFVCERIGGQRCKNHKKKMTFLRGKLKEIEAGKFRLQNVESVVERIIEKDPDRM